MDKPIPKTFAQLVKENMMTPEECDRIYNTMIRDAYQEGKSAGNVMNIEWLPQSNSAFKFAGGGRICLMITDAPSVDRAAETLQYHISMNYQGDDPCPTIDQVKAAMLDELARHAEKMIGLYADYGDVKRCADLDDQYTRIAEMADAKMQNERTMEAARLASKRIINDAARAMETILAKPAV